MESQKLIVFEEGTKQHVVKFPNVGQFMDIEGMKMALTNGDYAKLAVSPLSVSALQLDIVDAISYFSILIPDLKKDYDIKNWRDLDTATAKKLSIIYKKQFLPWFKPLLDDLLKVDKEDETANTQN